MLAHIQHPGRRPRNHCKRMGSKARIWSPNQVANRFGRTAMATRIRLAWLITFGVLASPTWADDGIDDVRAGRRVAFLVCYACHVVAPDQHDAPTLTPPAPSFESIAQRPNISAESLQRFLATTHRDASNPRAMPNPALINSYARQVASYILSLRRLQQ